MSKKLVLIVPSFPKLSETFIVSKFLGLLERGWEVTVVCRKSDASEWKSFPALVAHPEARHRVKVAWPTESRLMAACLSPLAFISCAWRNPTGTLRYLRLGLERFGVTGTLQRFYVDAAVLALSPGLIHFEFGTLAVGQPHLKQLLDCKVIASFRGYDLNFSGLEERDYFGEMWGQIDAVHLLGTDLWQRAQRRGCPKNKTKALIPPAIDARHFDPDARAPSANDGSRERPIRILSVGRLEWKKGYEYAIQAIGALRDLGVHCQYSIIGHGNYIEAVSFARKQLGVTEEVRLLGAQSPTQVREHLREADIFLHTAVSEGFCNAVLEAQAMALPVVSSDADGLAENVADGQTGFVVPRRSPEALAEKLAVLARDSALRKRMGESGRQRVLERFQVADQIAAFETFYGTVLSENSLDKKTEPFHTPELADSQSLQAIDKV